VAKRSQFDLNAPGTKALSDQIVHGAFVTEGTMVAFPPCFPGVTLPVPADECHITALDVASSGMIYAGTSGHIAHMLVGMFHGVTGMVLDMGVVEGATQTAAVCCGQNAFVAAVNGPAGGRLVMRELQELPFDLIQEWHIRRTPYRDLGEVMAGEKILHAVCDATRRKVVGVTESRLFALDIEAAKVDVVGEVPAKARLALGAGNVIVGMDLGAALWAYDVERGTLRRRAFAVPDGDWDQPALMWARDPGRSRLYTADAGGRLYSFAPDKGFALQGRTPIAPIGPMAVTLDGRLFGTMGEGMSKLFCFDPDSRQVTNLGVAVSVFERRRYGYTFGDADVGRDGEIVWGEDDDLGHLWLYFPKVRGTGGVP
jgi:hypothetical protein